MAQPCTPCTGHVRRAHHLDLQRTSVAHVTHSMSVGRLSTSAGCPILLPMSELAVGDM